ncbi:hypothetical protein WAI453_010319 [Rhynchosporium graminicola]
MARWITPPAVTKHMLRRPKVVLEFTNEHLQTFLRAAAISDHGIPEKIHKLLLDGAASAAPAKPWSDVV